jgi:hypothetical protein
MGGVEVANTAVNIVSLYLLRQAIFELRALAESNRQIGGRAASAAEGIRKELNGS